MLFLSRIHEKKGIIDLIHAFGSLGQDDWELVIAGNDDGGHESRCRALAAQQPNSDRIQFIGSVSDADKWAVYESADLFVLPSYSENFGIVVGEALGSGVPVLTTSATPWAEFASGSASEAEAKGLWIVEPGPVTLKDALRGIVAIDPNQLIAAGRAGADWVRSRFTWEAVGREFLEKIQTVLSDHRR
jgi:glycosyltransferase involved in cell wall biosynthesis